MAGVEVVVSPGPGETRLAVLEDGLVVQIVIARSGAGPGSVWLGRIVRAEHGLAFVDIGGARPGVAFAKGLAEGESVLVQCVIEARADKGPELTIKPSLAGRMVAYTPAAPGVAVSRRISDLAERERLLTTARALAAPDEGVVVRTQATGAPTAALAEDLGALRAAWRDIQARAASTQPPALLWEPDPLDRLLADLSDVRAIIVDDDATFAAVRRRHPELAARHRDGSAFAAYGVDDTLSEALEPRVSLPSGGSLVIEETTALTAIDVNSGGGKAGDANREAVAAIARQLRLRNLSGHIVVDFIPERGREARRGLIEAMRRAVASDPVPTHVVGTSPLGLVEMTRERRRASLNELMLETARNLTAEALALGTLRRLVRESAGHGTPTIAASPDVIEALRRLPQAMGAAADRIGRMPVLRGEAGRGRDDIDIIWA